MPGATPSESPWLKWPSFTPSKGEVDFDDELIRYKQDIVSLYGEAALRQSWLKTCAALKELTDEIAVKGTRIIPEVRYEEMLDLGQERKEELLKRGAFVVRGVVDQHVADAWFHDLKGYVADNRAEIGGWPEETPFVLRLYWSPTQLAIRSHPRHLSLQRTLNEFWTSSPSPSSNTSPEPLSYADAVRIRPPGIPFPGLGPHIDAGSLCRWVDPSYRSVYSSIFSGNPEEHDCYDLEKRKDAQQSIFDGGYHSSLFRAFQGWTALTAAGKGEGSLMLYPDVKTAIAYMLIRPFFSPPPPPDPTSEEEEDIMDASRWAFTPNTPWFPGTFRNESQMASPASHPHLRLEECMVNIPRMGAGDSIWWHCDMLHAVEVEHHGHEDASVAYVAATPTTEINKAYMTRQAEDFLNGGRVPEDFRGHYPDERGESRFKGWIGEDGIIGLEGKRAAGLVQV